MNKKFNRKKLFLTERKFFFIIFIFILIIFIFFYAYKNFFRIKNLMLINLEKFSVNFNYTLQYYEISGLNHVDEKEIIETIKPYINKSIFLLPLNNISDSILENNWIKTLKLKIDYKNKIFIEINEFIPIGIYFFNNNKYYFNSKGKIIDYVSSRNFNNDQLITFSGELSTLNAYSFLKILNELKKNFNKKILQANFIKNRRWDLLLEDNLLIMLSETHLQQSIENYIKLTNNLSYNDLNSIKIIDLRDYQKAIIEYK